MVRLVWQTPEHFQQLCAMPDHSCLCDELDPTHLLSRNGNPDVEHVDYYSSLHSAIECSVWKTTTEVILKYNFYVSVVY